MAQEIRGWRHEGNGQWVKGGMRIFYRSRAEATAKGRKAKNGMEGWILSAKGSETVHPSRDAAMDAAE